MSNNDQNSPLDADARRRADLEQHISETLDLIKKYEEKIRLSDDPGERKGDQIELARLKQSLQEYQNEYAELTGRGVVTPQGQTTLMSFPETWLAQLPHPIAVACVDFNQADDATRKFLALDQLLRSTVKYLTAVALAQYRHDLPHSDQLRPWLNRISGRHLSEWAILLTDIETHYHQSIASRPVIVALIFDAFHRPLSDDTAMTCAYQDITERLQTGTERPLTIEHCVKRLITYRERTWEAGVTHLPQGFSETLIPLLQPAIRELLDSLPLIRDYPLRYARDCRHTKEDWNYEMVEWRGPDKGTVCGEDCRVTGQGSEPPYKPRRLYLCAPNGQPLLNVHPLLIHHKDCLHFLESVGENQELAFHPCHGGAILQIPENLHSSLLTIFKQGEDEEKMGEKLNKIEEKVDEMNAPPESPPEKLSLSELMERLDSDGRQVLEIALGESLRIGRFWLGVEFLLMGLSKQGGKSFPKLLKEMGIPPGDFRGILRGMVGVITEDWRKKDVNVLGTEMLPQIQVAEPEQLRKSFQTGEKQPPVMTPRMFHILQDAVKLASGEQVGHNHLLTAAFRHHRAVPVNMFFALAHEAGQTPERIFSRLAELAEISPEGVLGEIPKPPEGAPLAQNLFRPAPDKHQQRKGILDEFGRNLTQLARDEKLHAAEGESARKAMAQIGRILLQHEANNPILIGDPGVGKTAVVEGFAWRMAGKGKGIVKQLANRSVIELSANTLTAGTKYRGDLEERLQQLLHEVKAAEGQIIIFIDEIHSILGGGASGGLSSIADAVKPALARGEFPCIGATTVAEYRKHIEKDAALTRRFTLVWIEEPGLEDAIRIVQKVAEGHLIEHHKDVTVTPEAVEAAVKLSARYLHDEHLPGKAIKVLDQACSGMIIPGSLSGEPQENFQTTKGKVVTKDAVLEVIANRTNIPVEQLAKTDKERLRELENRLKTRIFAQNEAIAQVARVVKRAGAGLADPRRPFGVFLFAGPTGVGKTELALALTEALFDNEDAIFRLDMSEFMEKHQVARLIGAPPGYVGYENEGQLTGHLRRRPYSVVLLDEMEKAHEDVQHLFLQLFDTGRLTDSQGRLTDGRNVIFIMTTNLGAKEALGFVNVVKSYQEKLKVAIDDHFSMEFINRIDRIVYFTPLNEEALVAIFDREFSPFQIRLQTEKGVEVTVAENVKHQIAKQAVTQLQGARPLRRLIEDQIVTPIVDKLLTGEYQPGTKIKIDQELQFPDEQPQPKLDPGKLPFDLANMPLAGLGQPAPQSPKPKRPATPEDGLPHLDNVADKDQKIFDESFMKIARRLFEQGITLEIDRLAKFFLCTPDQPLHEGRSMEETFEKLIEEPLTERLLNEELQKGDWIRIDYKFQKIVIEKI